MIKQNSTKKSARSRGFTLIELLVVISIIGMLSSVVLVSVQNARVRSVNTRILQTINQIRNQAELDRTSSGYPNYIASSNNIATYSTLTTNVKTMVADILSQLGLTVDTGYPGTSAGVCGSSLSATGAGVVISTAASTQCTNATDYAIYASLSPKGSGGYVCVDSTGSRASASSGDIPTITTPGSCPISSSNAGSINVIVRLDGSVVANGSCQGILSGPSGYSVSGGCTRSVTGLAAGTYSFIRTSGAPSGADTNPPTITPTSMSLTSSGSGTFYINFASPSQSTTSE